MPILKFKVLIFGSGPRTTCDLSKEIVLIIRARLKVLHFSVGNFKLSFVIFINSVLT